jgi:hypothetical protein
LKYLICPICNNDLKSEKQAEPGIPYVCSCDLKPTIQLSQKIVDNGKVKFDNSVCLVTITKKDDHKFVKSIAKIKDKIQAVKASCRICYIFDRDAILKEKETKKTDIIKTKDKQEGE